MDNAAIAALFRGAALRQRSERRWHVRLPGDDSPTNFASRHRKLSTAVAGRNEIRPDP